MLLTYEQATDLLARSRNGRKKVGNNTYLVRTIYGDLGVRLHNTVVVVINPDGTYSLNSGGYRTATTKARVNEFSPARIYQRDFKWYIGEGIPFDDWIIVDSAGRVVNPCGEPTHAM